MTIDTVIFYGVVVGVIGALLTAAILIGFLFASLVKLVMYLLKY